jgi:hypothetical protein
MLVIISSVLLRSQALLSSARSINFDPKAPNQAAESLPFEVQLTIWIILACISIPFLVLFKPLSILQSCMMVLKLCWWKLKQLHERLNRRTHVDGRSNSMQLKDSTVLVASDSVRNNGADLEMDLFADANSNAPDQRVGCDRHSTTLSVSAQKRAHDEFSIPLEPAPFGTLKTGNSVEISTEPIVHDAAKMGSSVKDDNIVQENGAAGKQHLEEDAADSMRLVSSLSAATDPLLAKNHDNSVVLAAKSTRVAQAQSLITGNIEPDAESVHLSIMSILYKIPQIMAMPKAAVESAVRASVRVVGTPGELLIRKGDFNTFMIYLVVGSVQVMGDDEKQVVDLHQGNLVGSQAFIYKRPRSANVRCFGRCVFYRFDLGRAPPVYLSEEERRHDSLESVALSSSASKADAASVQADVVTKTSNVPSSQSNLLQDDSTVAPSLNARSGAESAMYTAMRPDPARFKKQSSKKPKDSGPAPNTVMQRLRIMGAEYEEC